MDKSEKDIITKLNGEYVSLKESKAYKIGTRCTDYMENLKKLKLSAFTDIFKSIFMYFRLFRHRQINHRFVKIDDTDVDYKGKIIVYKAVFGNYDSISEPAYIDTNCEYYLITDNKIKSTSIWKSYDLSPLQSMLKDMTDPEKNRFFKMHPNIAFPNARYTIYVDGNVDIYGALSDFIKYTKTKTGIAMFNMSLRDCLYDEAKFCAIVGKTNKNAANAQLKKYEQKGMPRHFGMCECSVIVLDNDNSNSTVMDKWWKEYLSSPTHRDQIAFPYVLWHSGYQISDVGCIGDNLSACPYFRRVSHT